MDERVLHATFAGGGPAATEDEVVEVLLSLWIIAVYHTSTPPTS
jgi:hypothetical protein